MVEYKLQNIKNRAIKFLKIKIQKLKYKFISKKKN